MRAFKNSRDLTSPVPPYFIPPKIIIFSVELSYLGDIQERDPRR